MGILSLSNISQVFKSDNGDTITALKDINLDIKEGEFVCIIGPSGCGKTTLLRLIAGISKPASGNIILDGKNIIGPNPMCGMVFQEFSLFPWNTALKNVEFGLKMQGVKTKKRKEIAKEFLDLVDLNDFENRYPHELSGGMKQRVAIARALAQNPVLLLMDEPFASVDAQTRNMLQKALLEIWKKTKKTIIFVTHSVDEAIYLSDRIVLLSKRPGRISEIKQVEIKRPRNRTSGEVNKLREYLLMKIEHNK